MKHQLNWIKLIRGTHTAELNPLRLDCWGMGHWNVFHTITQEYIASGKEIDLDTAKEVSTNHARNWISPIVCT